MKQKMNSLRNAVLTLCVLGPLAFGTTQAMAFTGCLTCSWPSGVECAGEQDPNDYCDDLCKTEWGCVWGGACHLGAGSSECRCYEK